MLAATVCTAGLGSLSPKPARSQAQTRVVRAIAGWTLSHTTLQSPRPALRITSGEPSPMQTK